MRSTSNLNGHASRNGHAACGEPRHSIDFRSVTCHLGQFSFSPARAAAVRILWEAWENGTPDVGQAYLLEAVDSTGGRVSNLFNKHPAWGTLIVTEVKGAYRLQEPASPAAS